MKIKLTYILFFSIVILHLTFSFSDILKKGDNFVFDISEKIKNSILSNEIIDNSVVIVDIDEKSLSQVGQWPWQRMLNAKLLDNISSNNPSSILIDFIFPEKDNSSPKNIIDFYKNFLDLDVNINGLPKWLMDNDIIFAESIKNSKATLPIYLNNNGIRNKCILKDSVNFNVNLIDSPDLYRATDVLCNEHLLQENAKHHGFINALPDEDGIFRRIPISIKYKDQLVNMLSVSSILSTKAFGNKIDIEKTFLGTKVTFFDRSFYSDKHSNILLNFYDMASYKKISAVDILTDNYDPKDLLGKFVVIGTSSVGLHDQYIINTGQSIPGMYAHATIIENFFNNDIISEPEIFKKLNIIISFLSSLFIIYLMFSKRYIFISYFVPVIIITYILGGIIALISNLYISPGYFLINFIFSFVLISLVFVVITYIDSKNFFENLSKSHQATLESMATVAETRDTDTGGHIIRTKTYVKLLAQNLAKIDKYKEVISTKYIDSLFYAAPLHDLGKVAIPDNILKKAGKLTFEEFEHMKQHSEYGFKILKNAESHYHNPELFTVAKNIAYYHHEKWDGSGYPKGLKGENIPLEARLVAIADVYDALISKRCYKESFSYEKAEQIIVEGKGKHFDPEIVDIFLEIKEELKAVAENIKD